MHMYVPLLSCIFHPTLFFRTRTARGGHAVSLMLISIAGFHNALHLNFFQKTTSEKNAIKRGHAKIEM